MPKQTKVTDAALDACARAYIMGREAGIRAGIDEVVEWVEMNANISGISISRENWEAQLGKWRRV